MLKMMLLGLDGFVQFRRHGNNIAKEEAPLNLSL